MAPRSPSPHAAALRELADQLDDGDVTPAELELVNERAEAIPASHLDEVNRRLDDNDLGTAWREALRTLRSLPRA